MWWHYGNFFPITNIMASIELLPHYTITFKPFFQFIILGVIPGTNINIDIEGIIMLFSISLLLYTTTFVKKSRSENIINYWE